MRRQESRVLRAIEKNLEADDPQLAEQLRSFGGGAVGRVHRIAGWLAVPLLLLGVSLGDVVLLLTGLLLTLWVLLSWLVRMVR